MHLNPKENLKKYWGFDSFQGSQERIISAVIGKQDVLALMPTGGGKSICYQIPALSKEGLCIVVSPLVALIQNQVASLKEKGIKAIALTGGISFNDLNDLLDNCIYGNYKFLYLSPERLQQSLIQERIQQMEVNLMAIDEAHCISQWGNDFRPSYLECAILRELQPEVPIIALTATATQKVQHEIIENLDLSNVLVVKDSFLRKNIAFQIKKTEDKRYQLKKIFKAPEESAIVYVRTRRKTVEVAEFLRKLGIKTTFYHGGLQKVEKKERLNAWLSNKVHVIVATNAFGMGVDKPDVRQVVHYQIPDSIENYFQEAGRAGRDGQQAIATILTNADDIAYAKNQFLKSQPDTVFVKKLYQKLNAYLRVAYGEGSGLTFGLNFNAFCNQYQLNSLLAYNGLRILDQNSVLSLSEAFHQKVTLQFTATQPTLFNYLEKNSAISDTVLVILRTYGGIFDFETPINTHLLSKKANQSEKYILEILQKLNDDNIAHYKASSDDLELTFLTPREDDKTINRFAKKIQLLNQNKSDHLKSMLSYISNEKQCRSSFILKYFDENQLADCGICDVCQLKKKDNRTHKDIKSSILKELHLQNQTSRALVGQLEFAEHSILKALRTLIEEEIIVVNHKNEYGIKK